MMKRVSFLVVGAALAAQLACSSSDEPGPSSAAGAAGLANTAGSGGSLAGAPSAGASGALAGAAGSAGSGGSAGSASGSAGSGGSSAGAGGAATFGKITCAPTGMGDGKFELAPAAANPPEWTLQGGTMAGKVSAKLDFVSASYTPGHFKYWIYTSANYVMGSPAVFLLFNGDGGLFLNDFHAPTVIDNLTASGALPPTVALFIDPPSDGTNGATESDRQKAYDPPTDKYTTFLFNEILPAVIFDKYSVSRDPEAWAIFGFSASGGQGWKVLWNRPNDIHKFIGFNSSFGAAISYDMFDWVKVVTNDAARPYLRAALLTSTKDLADNRGNWQTINTNMANALNAKGAKTRLMVFQATCANTGCAHYPPVDGERDMPNAIRWAFQGCKF